MSTDTRHYGQGTELTQSFPFGFYIAGRALCADGRVRSLKRIASTADSFYSIPAAVTVSGRTVSGWVEVVDDVVRFYAASYGRNAHLLDDRPQIRPAWIGEPVRLFNSHR